MPAIKEYTADMGIFASDEKSKELFEKNKAEREAAGQKPDGYTRLQFFGKDKLEALLHETGDSCVGLKISFILEDDELLESLLIQAVDKEGKVLEIHSEAKSGSGGGGGNGVYGGPKCPRDCPPT